MEYVLKTKKEEFCRINTNRKGLLIRIDNEIIRKIKCGDMISFENYEKYSFNVLRVTKYKNIEQIFANEKVENIDSGEMSIINNRKSLRKIYPKEREARGLFVIELIKQVQNNGIVEIVSLPELAKDNLKIVDQIIKKAYEIKNFIGEEEYTEKTISSILNDDREILVCNINKKVAGFVLLKKENGEKKICYFQAFNKFCTEQIVTKLIERSFDFLETDKPYIVLENHNFTIFKDIIEKYEWQQTKIISCDNKDNSLIEMVFNGIN